MTTQRGALRGLAHFRGAHWHGLAGTWAPADVDVTLTLEGNADDGDRVRAVLALLDDPRPTLYALSYEACVALDPRLPRKSLASSSPGPDVLVRRVQRSDAAQHGAAHADARDVQASMKVRLPDDAARIAHEQRVRIAKERLHDGVIYQANLAHRLVVEHASHDEGLAFFVARAPSAEDAESVAPPCAAFVDIPSWGSIISLSPERFVHKEGARATTWPIKGTRPRGATPDDDARLLRELCASEKDAAEHVMIVDLLRNDLGKVAVAGGVTVERLLDVISVKNVHHLESTIVAHLRDEVTTSAVLAATVPGGSITGAPKSSAVEVIHELEDGPRGFYTGVLGIGHGGHTRSSLLIRTWLRPDEGEGSLHVGGGIVVDSEPNAEWRETLDKARAFL